MTTKSLVDKLGDALVRNGLISEKGLKRIKDIHTKEGGSFISIVVREAGIDEDRIVSTMSRVFSMPAVDLTRYKIEKECVDLIPEKTARQHCALPICRLGDTLVVAMADPLNIFAIDDLNMVTGCNIEPVLSTEASIRDAIERLYKSEHETITDIVEGEEGGVEVMPSRQEEYDISDAVLEGGTRPIVKLVNLIIIEALKKRASDIHVEPQEDGLRIRYRIDGNLHDILKIPGEKKNAVIARLKIMSGMDITESRLPQDGRFKIKLREREVDFRVSALPTTFGSKVVLRALDKSNLSIGLDSLGFSRYALARFKEAIEKPFGMILVTGPTGSGKSTTLYSIISQLNTPERNIITIEDPVEYQIDGITQIQTNSEIGLTFASGLRSLLRQSPDVIMIGEIRDSETADIAIKASLTGQLVLSTLHTNDAPSTINRLMDMGVEPFLIASSLILIAAQRLLRVICKACKGKGCERCARSGYYGRRAILEVLSMDDRLREMIIRRAPLDEIREYAISKGMKTLREDAMEKYKKGVTTMEEVIRVTSER